MLTSPEGGEMFSPQLHPVTVEMGTETPDDYHPSASEGRLLHPGSRTDHYTEGSPQPQQRMLAANTPTTGTPGANTPVAGTPNSVTPMTTPVVPVRVIIKVKDEESQTYQSKQSRQEGTQSITTSRKITASLPSDLLGVVPEGDEDKKSPSPSPPVAERSSSTDPSASSKWNLLCFGSNPQGCFTYFTGMGIISMIILASLVNLSTGNSNKDIWIALLSWSIGFICPDPHRLLPNGGGSTPSLTTTDKGVTETRTLPGS